MNPRLTHRLDAEIDDLWFRRDNLSEPEWSRLYTIVCELLLSYRPSELGGLRDERKVYVHDFFVDKVFRPDSVPSHVHVGALKVYYRRFLRDRLDQASADETHLEQGAPGEISERPDGSGGIQELAGEEIGDGEFKQLEEHGWSIDDLRASARKWLESNEAWVPVYLALNFCPDNDKREPLVHVAARFGIRSYAYRAAKLGINWGQASRPSPDAGLSDTLIGRWVTRDVGIELVPGNAQICLAVFKILCLEALYWAERSGLGQ